MKQLKPISLLLFLLGVICMLTMPACEIVSRRMVYRERRVYFYPHEVLSLDKVNQRISDMLYYGIHRGYRYSLPANVLFGLSAVIALLSGRRSSESMHSEKIARSSGEQTNGESKP
jgi:hypothetical protein